MRRRLLLGVAAGLAAVHPAGAQPSLATMKSTVRITCAMPTGGNVMDATGFVWPDELHVVTALHAVAGCKSLSVFSEATGSTSAAEVTRVMLERDLAWLTLGKALGVGLARAATAPPNLSSRFDVVGYPWGVDAAKSDPVTFSGGMKGAVVTLESAYGAVPDMQAFFDSSDQTYPTRKASILRVGSTLQPGHSGAPIFDSEGRVAAMADGGLFKGFAGMNWSIPADIYLPRLQASNDPKPAKPSKWAVQFSVVAVPPSAPVALPTRTAAPKDGQAIVNEKLQRVRRLTLQMVDDLLREKKGGAADARIEKLRASMTPDAFNALAFDIYEDDLGFTFGIPSQLALVSSGRFRGLEAVSPDGGARMALQWAEDQVDFERVEKMRLGQERTPADNLVVAMGLKFLGGYLVVDRALDLNAGLSEVWSGWTGNDAATRQPMAVRLQDFWNEHGAVVSIGVVDITAAGAEPSPADAVARTMMHLALDALVTQSLH